MIKKLFLLLVISGTYVSSFAQDFPNELKPTFQRILFLTELQYFDSATQVIDSLESTLDQTDANLSQVLFMFKFEIASHSGDCKTKSELTLYALNNFQDVIAPDSFALADLYNDLALDFKCLGQLDQSVTYFKKAIQFDPNSQFLISNLAGVYIAQNNYLMALNTLQGCTDIEDPSHDYAMIRKAKCYFELDSSQNAKDILLSILDSEMYYKDPLGNTTLGDVYAAEGQNDLACEHYKRARRPEQQTFKDHPNNGEYRYTTLVQEMIELQLKIKSVCK